jgi:hypothetical protein
LEEVLVVSADKIKGYLWKVSTASSYLTRSYLHFHDELKKLIAIYKTNKCTECKLRSS